MAVRVIAIDWSGAKKNARRKIWLAEFRDGQALLPESGRDQDETISHLISAANQPDKIVVGLDFAFSCPSWFVREEGCPDIGAFWNRITFRGETWLQECDQPFWGRHRRKCLLQKEQLFRTTEACTEPVLGIRPKSVFQLAGAGHVGTGSLRGMKFLPALRKAGYAIWPFETVAQRAIVEIYPRLLTGTVNKGNRQARAEYLSDPKFETLPDCWRETAASCEDAFDAAISAYVMNRELEELLSLKATTEPDVLLEGSIWTPEKKN